MPGRGGSGGSVRRLPAPSGRGGGPRSLREEGAGPRESSLWQERDARTCTPPSSTGEAGEGAAGGAEVLLWFPSFLALRALGRGRHVGQPRAGRAPAAPCAPPRPPNWRQQRGWWVPPRSTDFRLALAGGGGP